MNTKLEDNYEFRAFRWDMESRLRQLETEISHMKWKQTTNATDRSISFWSGAALFTWLLLLVAFAKDWT